MSERIVATDGHEGHWYTGEEIVRCRDCKHCRLDDSRWYCSELMFDIDFVTSNTPPDSFCSWGERRDA